MKAAKEGSRAGAGVSLLGVLFLTFLLLPLVALMISSSVADLQMAIGGPVFLPALALSLGTSAVSLGVIVVLGTPLAYWLARSGSRLSRVVSLLVDVPIVLPPAVVGVGLLLAWGKTGVLSFALGPLGVNLPFTAVAVVMAQVVVAAPFYVQAAAAAFGSVEQALLSVARSLGASPTRTFTRVVWPLSLPGIVAGASLSWARALGEFGATLIFAGNLPGRTQTLPLGIYAALESDVSLAVAISLSLAVIAIVLLGAARTVSLRLSPRRAK